MRKLTQSEKTLSCIVAAALFILLNIILGSYFLNHKAKLTDQIATKTNKLKSLQVLFADRQLWDKRAAWLQQKQPPLSNDNRAGEQLLEYIKSIAQKNDVLLENPGFATPAKTSYYHSVSLTIETKSTWPALIAFLRSVQQPEQFLVFESANVQIESTDPSMMHGKFRIAKWYAP